MGEERASGGVDGVLGNKRRDHVSRPALAHDHGRQPRIDGTRLNERVEDRGPEPRIEVVNGRLDLDQVVVAPRSLAWGERAAEHDP